MVKKTVLLMSLFFLLIGICSAIPLFTGVIETVDPKDRVVFIDGKMYRLTENATLEDARPFHDGTVKVEALRAGQRVHFQLETLKDGENRIVYLVIQP